MTVHVPTEAVFKRKNTRLLRQLNTRRERKISFWHSAPRCVEEGPGKKNVFVLMDDDGLTGKRGEQGGQNDDKVLGLYRRDALVIAARSYGPSRVFCALLFIACSRVGISREYYY